jgi:hypothetical protein
MMCKRFLVCLPPLFALLTACNSNDNKAGENNLSKKDSATKGTYAYDVDFLKKHTTNVVELQNQEGNARVLLSADYQGRVMTSTANGDSGTSYGWINYNLIERKEKKKQFNPVGGEERFWMGPEGGQYSIYFKAGDSFNIAHWQVPAIIDTIPYDVVQSDKNQAVFTKKATVTNYSGTNFDVLISRKIALLDKSSIEEKLQLPIPSSVHFVGFETTNSIQNTGTEAWTREKGLLSIWLLSMMTPTPQTTVIIPFSPQKNARSFITDNYFGQIPPERLVVKDSVLFFTCDGKQRSKIGLSPVIAKNIAASFDFKNNVLTLLLLRVDKNGMYVNSKWELQKQPYKGDVINSYNDGPLQDGSQLGPFYEIESSSAASELKKGQVQEYQQTVCHLQGDYHALLDIAKQLLGVNLDEIKK